MKKIIALLLVASLTLSLGACGKKDDSKKETTPPETEVMIVERPVPSNMFTNQSYALKTFEIGGTIFELNDQLDKQLTSAGLRQGISDMAQILVLGYTKAETNNGSTIFYQGDPEYINCMSYKLVNDAVQLTVSFKMMDADKLNIKSNNNTPIGLMQSNERFTYANGLTLKTTGEEAIEMLGEPTEKETEANGAISNLKYIHKNDEGKTDNKLELEFAANKLYKITITQKLV